MDINEETQFKSITKIWFNKLSREIIQLQEQKTETIKEESKWEPIVKATNNKILNNMQSNNSQI